MAPAAGMGELLSRLHDRLQSRGVAFEFNRRAAAADLETSERIAICTGARGAAALLSSRAPDLAEALTRMRMVSIVIATAFFEPRQDDLRGFGVLFPRSTGVRALGALFNTEIFEGRGELRSESWIYGDLDAANLPAAATEANAAVVADRRLLTRQSASPVASYVTIHRDALPVYDDAVQAARAALAGLPPTLAVTGNYLGRLGVAALLDGAAEVPARFGLGDVSEIARPRSADVSGTRGVDRMHTVAGTAVPRS
jgi:protoporphyrinogen oxidase